MPATEGNRSGIKGEMKSDQNRNYERGGNTLNQSKIWRREETDRRINLCARTSINMAKGNQSGLANEQREGYLES
jgi:hypothetical protein